MKVSLSSPSIKSGQAQRQVKVYRRLRFWMSFGPRLPLPTKVWICSLVMLKYRMKTANTVEIKEDDRSTPANSGLEMTSCRSMIDAIHQLPLKWAIVCSIPSRKGVS